MSKKTKIILAVVAVAVIAGAVYYFKVYKPNKEKELASKDVVK